MINGKHHCQWDQLPRRAVGTEKRSLTATLWLSLFFLTQPFVVSFLVLVVLVVFCCLSFKRSIFFPLHLTYCLLLFQCIPSYQQHSTTKRKNKNHKNTISFSKNPISNNKFSAFEGGKKKCLPHFLPSMLQDLSSTPPLSFSLSSHVFPLLVVLMMVQIIFS